MNRIKRYLAIVLCFALITQGMVFNVFAEPKTDYADIVGHWANQEIQELMSKEIVEGSKVDGVYYIRPETTITRAEFITIVLRALYSKTELNDMVSKLADNSVFSDISAHWGRNNILLGKSLGLIEGYTDGTFKPDSFITRSEMVALLVRIEGLKAAGEVAHSFGDLKSDFWAYSAIQKAVNLGLINGYPDNSFGINKNAKRAEAFVIIHRLMKLLKSGEDIVDNTTPKGSLDKKEELNIESYDDNTTTATTTTDTPSVPSEPSEYKLSFENTLGGAVDIRASGSYAAGTSVKIRAQAEKYYKIGEWVSSSGGSFGDKNAEETTFVMPASDTVLKMNFVMEFAEDGDEDKDGLENAAEVVLGTDPNKADTDDDELSDNDEVTKTMTNPLVADTDGDGTSDAAEDFDGDGLKNKEEIEEGTNPLDADTDGDELPDGDEKNKHNTDPLKYDTDEDGISDGDEIRLGLNPLKAKTDDLTPDGAVEIEQTTDDNAKSESVIESDNWMIPNVSGKVAGYISRRVYIDESDSDVLEDNRAVLSDKLDISTDYDKELTLSFKLTEEYKGDVKNIVIVKYGDDLKVLETTYDEDANTVSATISEGGLYFVIDLEEFLKAMGIDALSEISEKSMKRASIDVEDEYIYRLDNDGNVIEEILREEIEDNSEDMLAVSFNAFKMMSEAETYRGTGKTAGQADIVFVIDTTGSMSGAIDGVKNNVNKFTEELVNNYNIDANFALIEYKDITVEGVGSTILHRSSGSEWFTNVDVFKREINTLSVYGGGDGPETPIDALEMARNLSYRADSTKFVVLVTDAYYKMDNSHGIKSLEEMAELFKSSNIIVSAICNGEGDYSKLIKETDGVYASVYSDFYTTLLLLAKKIGELTNDGEWVLLSDYKAVKLSDKVENADKIDSDKDGIKDGDELTTSFERDLTSFIKYLLKKQGVPEEEYTGKTKVTMWNYNSNPVLLDTDYDGIPDGTVDYDGSSVQADAEPKDNHFKGYYHWSEDVRGKTVNYVSKEPVEFSVDYTLLFKDNHKYNKNLAVLASLYAGDVYDNSYIRVDTGAEGGSDYAASLSKLFGMKDIKIKPIAYGGSIPPVDKDDRSEIVIGHREVEYKNAKREIILLQVRGTNGTNEEWSSNFDVGADSIEYTNATGEHPQWNNKENHKGFDVATNRIIAEVNNYITEHSLRTKPKSILITGHSRGAAISNILGKYFEDDGGYKSYTYAFATPNTTVNSGSASYKTIFNIVNEDDIVPYMPIEHWGFKKYGKVKSISVEKYYENKWGGSHKGDWEWLVGNGRDYNNDGGTKRTLNSFKAICDNREQIYIMDDTKDGKALFSGLMHLDEASARREETEAAGTLEEEKLGRFSKLSVEKGVYYIGLFPRDVYYVYVQYSPAYLMQILANMTTEVGPMTGHNLSGKYNYAKWSFIRTSGKIPYLEAYGGMTDPHLPITYYLIAHNNFKK